MGTLKKKKNDRFSLPVFNNEIIEEFQQSNDFTKAIKDEVVSAFWADYNKFGYKTDFSFIYVKEPKSQFEEGCKKLGESIIQGYKTFTTKVMNKRKVRDIFIFDYYSHHIVYRCQFCGQILEQSGKTNKKITADLEHIIPKSLFPQFALHSQNLVPCCLECNRIEKVTLFNFKKDLSDFYKAFSELNMSISQRPFELWNKFTFKYKSNLEWEVNLDKYPNAYNLINHYGLPKRYKQMFGHCYNVLQIQLKHLQITSPGALEGFLEYLTDLAFDNYNGASSFHNSPHIWQDFLNEILYDRCKLEALWEEVRDSRIEVI